MIKSVLKGSAALIALYLVVNNYTGVKTDLTAGADGGVKIIKGFQARN